MKLKVGTLRTLIREATMTPDWHEFVEDVKRELIALGAVERRDPKRPAGDWGGEFGGHISFLSREVTPGDAMRIILNKLKAMRLTPRVGGGADDRSFALYSRKGQPTFEFGAHSVSGEEDGEYVDRAGFELSWNMHPRESGWQHRSWL